MGFPLSMDNQKRLKDNRENMKDVLICVYHF